jgi:hypothetical protein
MEARNARAGGKGGHVFILTEGEGTRSGSTCADGMERAHTTCADDAHGFQQLRAAWRG